jgi:hypothetical protein
MSTDKMTAAEHFAEAEMLLRRADGITSSNPATAAALGAMAQAHIAAAQFLRDLPENHHAINDPGLRALAKEREV